MKISSYPIVCPSCLGEGTIPNPSTYVYMTNWSQTITCPACHGTKIVIKRETIMDDKEASTIYYLEEVNNA